MLIQLVRFLKFRSYNRFSFILFAIFSHLSSSLLVLLFQVPTRTVERLFLNLQEDGMGLGCTDGKSYLCNL